MNLTSGKGRESLGDWQARNVAMVDILAIFISLKNPGEFLNSRSMYGELQHCLRNSLFITVGAI